MSLIIAAGMDPTSQAGMARDLAVCARMHVTAHPVPTCQTIWQSVHAVPVDDMLAMLEAAADAGGVAMKVGAVPGPDHARAVADFAQRHDLDVVLDPVLVSSDGVRFCRPQDLRPLIDAATVVTPNEAEAATLGLSDGARIHVTKGGDRPGIHRGTGCRFATTLACLRLRGQEDAFDQAHAMVEEEIAFDAAEQEFDPAARKHLAATKEATWTILSHLRPQDVPEVGINFAHALPGDPVRVCGLAGRITIAGEGVAWSGRVAFDGPQHTGRIVRVVQEYDPSVAWVMNHRYADLYVERAQDAGLLVRSYRRQDEPLGQSTMEWGVRSCIDGTVPDIIWDAGAEGKEPMIRILARSVDDLVMKLRVLHGQEALATMA